MRALYMRHADGRLFEAVGTVHPLRSSVQAVNLLDVSTGRITPYGRAHLERNFTAEPAPVHHVPRITWEHAGWDGEKGVVDGHELFRLHYPFVEACDDEIVDYLLTGPLVPSDVADIDAGMTISAPLVSAVDGPVKGLAGVRASASREIARFRLGRDKAHAVAERLLYDFAHRVLHGKEPS
jgi:hypothetical protein